MPSFISFMSSFEFEPQFEETYSLTYAPNKVFIGIPKCDASSQSDQSLHEKITSLAVQNMPRENNDQVARMRRLI